MCCKYTKRQVNYSLSFWKSEKQGCSVFREDKISNVGMKKQYHYELEKRKLRIRVNGKRTVFYAQTKRNASIFRIEVSLGSLL